MMKCIKTKAKLWVWPGDMPWNFVSLDQEISKSIRIEFPSSSMVKVEAEVNNIKWQTSLFRNNRDSIYMLPIKKDVRKKANLFEGEIIDLTINIL